MAEQTYGRESSETPAGVLRSALLIVVTGALLGVGYNALGLRNQTWGLSWKAEDRSDIPELELSMDGAATSSVPVADSDDPMAIPAAAAAAPGLPEIPDLGRPIQVQLEAAKRFYDAGAVVFVDAREPEEFAAGHIAGAINLPADQAVTDPALLETLDAGGKALVTYCGGGTCELSLNLGWALIGAGHSKVLVFMGGYPAWEQAGYPVATAEAG